MRDTIEIAAELDDELRRGASLDLDDEQDCDINEAVLRSAIVLRRSMLDEIELAIRPGPGLPRVRVPLECLERIVLHLVLSAADLMPDGGELTVRTSKVSLAEGRPHVLLSVRDTAKRCCGDVERKIFERLFSIRSRRGTPDNAATIVDGLVRSHAGIVHAEWSPSEGTTFDVYLPVAAQSLPTQAEAAG